MKKIGDPYFFLIGIISQFRVISIYGFLMKKIGDPYFFLIGIISQFRVISLVIK